MKIIGVMAFALSFAGSLSSAANDPRYEGASITFQHPPGWSFMEAADISAESAARGNAPGGGKKTALRSVLVLVGGKKVGDADLESEAAGWHAAHVRNRSAWGMRSEGGTPRELTRIAGKRAVRYRDQVGSALGANEQTLTCTLVSTRLACVIAAATPESREVADAVAAQILASLRLIKR